jgi:hypothetical protein
VNERCVHPVFGRAGISYALPMGNGGDVPQSVPLVISTPIEMVAIR